jgi:lipopolysaccharide biosynthesis regulator YciM
LLYPRLSEVHAKLGDLAGFEALLRERLDAVVDDREASLWLARTLATLKRVDDALGILRRLLDRDPGCLDAHAEIGRILLGEHRDEEAKKAFEELLARLQPEPRRLACRGCGTQDTRLHFRCPQCGEWDSFA